MDAVEQLIRSASPICDRCGERAVRVEIPWRLNGDGDWVPGTATAVCPDGHRTPVEIGS